MKLRESAGIIGAVLSALLLILAIGASLGLNRLEQQITDRTAVASARADALARWQREAPTVYAESARAQHALAPLCRAAHDLNGLLLGIVWDLNARHVLATASDFRGSYPSPAPTRPPPTPRPFVATLGLGSAAAPAPRPAPLLTPAPTALDDDAHRVGGLVRLDKSLTLTGPYPTVVAALASLQNERVPIEIGTPSIDRLGDRTVEAKTQLSIVLPPPGVCDAPPLPHRPFALHQPTETPT